VLGPQIGVGPAELVGSRCCLFGMMSVTAFVCLVILSACCTAVLVLRNRDVCNKQAVHPGAQGGNRAAAAYQCVARVDLCPSSIAAISIKHCCYY
jgi:hypothetical protein